MDPFKCLQITFFLILFTFRTGKWLFSCVDPFMHLQIAILCQCLATFGAGKRHLSCVDPFMSAQIIFYVNVLSHLEQAKGISSVWILSCLLQESFYVSVYCLNPFGAGKKYFSCVDPFISPQIIFLCRCLVRFGAGHIGKKRNTTSKVKKPSEARLFFRMPKAFI